MMVNQCIFNDPIVQYTIEKLLTSLQKVRKEVEGEYGGDNQIIE